jgi:hypothetical protein
MPERIRAGLEVPRNFDSALLVLEGESGMIAAGRLTGQGI